MLNKTEARFLFLGSGGSMGIPIIGCSCSVCQSTSPQNKRLRPSAAIKIENRIILIDCGPDFRAQALRQGITSIDSVILTHSHHDHTAGVDDLRIFTLRSGKPLPCLLSLETLNDLKRRFYYIFDDPLNPTGVKITTNLAIHCIEDQMGQVNFQGLNIRYISYRQGDTQVNGFRFGDLAYVTDIKEYTQDIFETLQGVKILVIGALRHTPSNLHFTVDDAVRFSKEVGAETTWLTHIAHELDHEETNAYLPESVRLSYDGLELPFHLE